MNYLFVNYLITLIQMVQITEILKRIKAITEGVKKKQKEKLLNRSYDFFIVMVLYKTNNMHPTDIPWQRPPIHKYIRMIDKTTYVFL